MQLLERDHLLQSMRALLRQAVGGSGRIALIAGEAGIGKTTLVERFRADYDRDARMLAGACDALFSPRPLGPLYDIARQTGGGLAALLDSDADRQAIFYAALSELGRTPTVAIFEDVHWADEATLDLLKFLGRRIHHTPALLVVTYRDDELGPQHPLRSLLGTFAGSAVTCRITLAPLSVDAVRSIVGERSLDARMLHRRTGGNPFFVTEVLAGEGNLPSTVRDAVLARAARLSPAAREVLDAAAAIGARVEPWLLEGITPAIHAAAECIESGVLKAQDDLLVFRHELARQTIWEAVEPPRRLRLHRAVLDVLRSSPLAQSEASRLAYHADAAGDGTALLQYAPEAARLAAAQGAHRAAADLWNMALRYAGDLPAEQQAPILEHYARHASRVDRRSQAIAARRGAIKLWSMAGDNLRQAENHAALVIMLIGAGRTAEAEQASLAAIELFESQASVQHLALGYETQAALRLFHSDYAPAIAWCDRALALPDIEQHGYIWRRARMRRAVILMFQDYQSGCAELEQLYRDARSAARFDPEQEVEAVNLLTNLGMRSTQLWHLRAAARYLADGLAYTNEREFDIYRHIMLAAQALINLYVGDWQNVECLAHEVLARPESSVLSRIPALEALGRLRSRRGGTDAWCVLDTALEAAQPTQNLQLLGPVCAARAEAAWLAGDAERAGAEACAAYDLALEKREPWIAGALLLWRIRAGHVLAIPDWIALSFRLEAQGDWRGAADEWQRLGCVYEQARALAEGDHAARLAALAIWDRLEARPAAAALRTRLRSSGVAGVPRGPRQLTRGNRYGLTARQTEILELLGRNMTNAEIAAQLHLSAKTVDHHVSAVLAKLDVHSRRDAGVLARAAIIAG